MRIGNVKIYETTSNAIIKLAYQNPLVLYNVKIIAINPQMNLTVTVIDSGGNQWSFSVVTGTEITFKKINYQAITFEDPNNYTIYYSIQAIYPDNYQELQQLEQESDISLIPINNVIITSPLDANGNVMVSLQNEVIIEFTSIPYSVPKNGRIVFQLEGSGTPATVSFNGGTTTYDINSGASLTNGAIYEFSVSVAQGDIFTVSGATFIRGFFISGVMV